MNLFTRFLRQWNHDPDLERLVEHWDALEALVIRVYRRGEATAADEAEYRAIRAWMQHHYTAWEKVLESHWRHARVAGQGAQEDPFRRLMAPEAAAGFVRNWAAMQHLPAARESLNQLLLMQDKDG